jgi:hypothetical protein
MQSLKFKRLIPVFTIVLGQLFAVTAFAATLTVTNLNDSGAGSLRDTVALAADGDTIDFSVTGTIALTTGTISIWGKNVTINGPGAASLTISGNSNSADFGVFSTSSLSLSGLTIANESGSERISVSSLATLSISNCVISGNSNPYFCDGGGIYSYGTLSISNSTIAGNASFGAVGALVADSGAGIYNDGGTITIDSSTISGNITTDPTYQSGDGGGIYNKGTLSISSSSISANTTQNFYADDDGFGGGIYNSVGATVTLTTSIVAANLGRQYNPSGGPAQDISGVVNSLGKNLIGDSDGSSGWIGSDMTGSYTSLLDPKLDPLADNGGPTQTMALLSGSPAVDVPTCINSPSLDQRGVARPIDGDTDSVASCDIGAFEAPACTTDSVAPQIASHVDITAGADFLQCSHVLAYTNPTATDNCGTVTVSCVPASGSAFPVGTTTVTCTASDAQNNTDSTSFTVTIVDTQWPWVIPNADLVVSTDAEQCSASVGYSNPAASDNCPGVTVTCNPASGSTFYIGQTWVSCTAKDASNNITSTSFLVDVQDTVAPQFTSTPSDITVSNDAGQCSAVVSYADPTATDNCGGVSVSCTPASGSAFSLGTTTVNCTATDAQSNTASTSFLVTVQDTEAPGINCPSDQTFPAGGTSGGIVNYTGATPADNCFRRNSSVHSGSRFIFPARQHGCKLHGNGCRRQHRRHLLI